MKICFTFANIVDPDEMPHYGFSQFANIPVAGIQNEKGYKVKCLCSQ